MDAWEESFSIETGQPGDRLIFDHFGPSPACQEKQVLRFVRLIGQLQKSGLLKELGLVPLLAGASSEETYAAQVGAGDLWMLEDVEYMDLTGITVQLNGSEWYLGISEVHQSRLA